MEVFQKSTNYFGGGYVFIDYLVHVARDED